MSHGLRTWNKEGRLTLDTNTFTYQILGQWVLDFSAATTANRVAYTLSIPGFKVATCVFFLVPIRNSDIGDPGNPRNQRGYPYVSVADGQVVVRSQNPQATNNMYSTNVVVRGYAIRYAL